MAADIFANNVSTEEVARLVTAFVPSSFYLTPYIDYLLAVPLPRTPQGYRIIDPDWKDQIGESMRYIFSNPVLVLKIASANYSDDTRYTPSYGFFIGTNGTKGAFPDSTRYKEIVDTEHINSGLLKLTPALIVAYVLSNGGSSNFRLQKTESDKLTKSYSDYVHDDMLARKWTPVLASFLFILKLAEAIALLKGSESAFFPMIDFTWKAITEEAAKRFNSLSDCDRRFYKTIIPIIETINREGSHRIFTHSAQLKKAVEDELRTSDSLFSQVLAGYCK